MRTVDIVKTLEADIDRFERDLSNIQTKLQYSYILLDRISRKEQKEQKEASTVPLISSVRTPPCFRTEIKKEIR